MSDNSTGFIATSDKRIKKNIVNYDNAMDILNQLQVKNYHYIEGNGNGNEVISRPPTIGFIAQEVEEILPRAVETKSGFIPNLYRETTNYTIVEENQDFYLIINETFNSNTIKIYINYSDGNMNSMKYKVSEKNKISNNNIDFIWLYGEEVNDYKTLKKSVIFSMNVRATWQLYSENQQLKAQINQLNQDIQMIKEHLNL